MPSPDDGLPDMGVATASLEYEAVKAPDSPPPDTDYEYACETCGVELHYGGRGRKPRFCAEHKKNAPKTPRVSAASAGRWQAPLQNALTANFAAVGMAVYAFEQFDGQIILQGSPGLASALVAVAETSPAVRQALESFVTAGAWAQVATAAAAIALPILAHHGKIPNVPFFTAMGVPAS